MTRRTSRPARGDGDRGATAVELVIAAPFVIVMLLLMVALGRYVHARQLVDTAAAAGARAATIGADSAEARADAQIAVEASIADAGLSCATLSVDVDIASFRPGGSVAVTVSCTADLSSLALAGVPGAATLTGDARSPLETYRDIR